MSELDLLDELDGYRRLFTDAALWAPRVERVLARHGLLPTGPIHMGVPGTCPTFISGERWVVKFFGRLFEGERAFRVEQEAARLMAARLIAARFIAPLAAWGTLDEGRWPWPYLVFEYIPGKSIGEAREQLSPADRLAAARWLGEAVRGIHDLPLRGSTVFEADYDNYINFLEEQRAGAVERHRAWGSLPPRLIEQIPGFIPPAEALVDTARPAHLIHADLTGDHLLGRFEDGHWRSLALIDFGDAMTGDLLYELGALQLDLFAADRGMLAAFLQAYRLPVAGYADLPRRALAAALLHRFDLFGGLPGGLLEGCASLADLAEQIFRPLDAEAPRR